MSRFPDPPLFEFHTMKALLSSLLAGAILLVSPTAVLAAKNTAAAAGTFKGKITALDPKAHTITLTQKKGGQSKTFNVHRAAITVDKQKHKHLADLKVGMKAKVKPGKKGHLVIAAKTHSAKKKKKPAA
jgi:hypothetical protein